MNATVLVMAKAPVAGHAKTRLAADLDGRAQAAADLAAAALLDTIEACVEAVGPARCRLALDGDLQQTAHAGPLRTALAGWQVVPQSPGGLDERLARAHQEIDGPVLQIGMDTPQVTPALLTDLIDRLTDSDATLAPATDGGWWALGLTRGGHGALLRGVPMSTPSTYARTRSALRVAGLRVADGPMSTDADRLRDARRIAAQAPWTRFARTLAALDVPEETS